MSDPKQLEIPGADDFNLAWEVIQAPPEPPAPDELTDELPL
jgi:hypothetical protein